MSEPRPSSVIAVPDQPPAGDTDAAFAAMVEAHYARLGAFAYRLVGSRAAAEDVVHEVLLRIWRRRDGFAFHDPLAYLQNRTVDWLDHQLAARELLDLDVVNTHLVVEHEYPKARLQDRERLKPILKGSIAFVRRIDEAAACMYALQHDVLPVQDIPVQGSGREPFRS